MNESHQDPLNILSTIPETRPGGLFVSTLGGVADIGMNWTLYGADDAFILVDAGTTFAPRDTVGVEAVMPDPKLFAMLGHRLNGLIVTHFHEDHVGAIHRLWPKYAKCPIYAPPFAARMLTGRFQDAGTKGKVKIKSFTPGSQFSIGPFSIRTIRVAHSTPDCVGLCIETKNARVIHTGDWKIDPDPGIGSRTDLAMFAALGDKGVDLMLCDSTNANREVPQSSEASVRRAMTAVFKKAKGIVFVVSFGSNVARMASVAYAAKTTRRKVALAGRSLRNAAEAAEALGLMKGVPPFLKDATKFDGTERRGCVLMCTGTQGEENAALAKLAEDRGRDGRLPRVKPGDVIVHSARIIPGNEDYVNAVLGKLADLGARIITADDPIEGDSVHVTGHPCREDLRAMYAAVRPGLAMPIHGSPMHLRAHQELALSLRVPAAMMPVDGGMYELKDGRLEVLGRLGLGRVAILGDGAGTIVPWDDVKATAILTEPDRARLDAHLDSERERAERRVAEGPRRDARPTRMGRSASKSAGEPEREGSAATETQGRSRRKTVSSPNADSRPVYGAQTRAFEVQKARPRSTRPPAKTASDTKSTSLALDGAFIERIGGYLTMKKS